MQQNIRRPSPDTSYYSLHVLQRIARSASQLCTETFTVYTLVSLLLFILGSQIPNLIVTSAITGAATAAAAAAAAAKLSVPSRIYYYYTSGTFNPRPEFSLISDLLHTAYPARHRLESLHYRIGRVHAHISLRGLPDLPTYTCHPRFALASAGFFAGNTVRGDLGNSQIFSGVDQFPKNFGKLALPLAIG